MHQVTPRQHANGGRQGAPPPPTGHSRHPPPPIQRHLCARRSLRARSRLDHVEQLGLVPGWSWGEGEGEGEGFGLGLGFRLGFR